MPVLIVAELPVRQSFESILYLAVDWDPRVTSKLFVVKSALYESVPNERNHCLNL